MFITVLAIIGMVVGILALIVGISALQGWIFMLLWNFVMPVFWASAPQIDFLHAWACWCLISLMSGIIIWVKQK